MSRYIPWDLPKMRDYSRLEGVVTTETSALQQDRSSMYHDYSSTPSGLVWVGMGWDGMGWVALGWVGLGWVGLGWVGSTHIFDTSSKGVITPPDAAATVTIASEFAKARLGPDFYST